VFEKIDVTEAQIIATLQDVVAEQPDFIYSAPDHMRNDDQGNECFYVHRDEQTGEASPGCVWGHVLSRLGVPLEFMEEFEGWPVRGFIRDAVTADLSVGFLTAAQRMQMEQDEHHPWSRALDYGLSDYSAA